MNRKSYPERVRSALFHAIKKTAANLDACVKVPGKDFSRKRKLPLQTMLLMLIGMGGGSLSKELYDWFGYTPSTATASAFVQQRNKIRSKAIEMIFNEFVTSAMPTMTFRGYRLFAVDGSDLRLPSDTTNDFSLIRNAEGQKQYNLAHLNAMFDLMSKAYVDVTLQGKKGMNEHKALVSMIDRSNISGKVIVLSCRCCPGSRSIFTPVCAAASPFWPGEPSGATLRRPELWPIPLRSSIIRSWPWCRWSLPADLRALSWPRRS